MKALFGKVLLGLSLLSMCGYASADEVKDSLIALAKN